MEQQHIFTQMALIAWDMQISRTEKFLDSLSDEALMKEIAPGKNRIIYLLGHLIAVNDGMMTLLGLGERSHVHLDEAFIKNPDNSGFDMPDASVLRSDWKKSNAQLSALFHELTPEEWLSKHTAMTDEDFVKTPTRNKMSVLLNRTSHVAYHLGQLALVK
ncbi:MAG: DinB family protein [Phycisphaerae bacterium]|nr:DinB family protein [Saprospiraceae bacterium]